VTRIIGSLRTEGGKGVVRMEDRIAAGVDEVWSAVTDPARLAHWLGNVEGDLHLGGEFRARFADGYEGTGRIEACEPARRLVTTMRSAASGEGTIEVTLAPEGDATLFVWEERGMPVEHLADYGAGIQIHVEELAAYLAGGETPDLETRWQELAPAYRELAAGVG
jgi:uncharacterized protein YndB with AHSA1/START domain